MAQPIEERSSSAKAIDRVPPHNIEAESTLIPT
jgi:hypothetical protein